MRVYMRGSTARVVVVLAFGVVFDCMYPSQSEKQSKTKMRVASGGPHWMEAATAARVVGVGQWHNNERVAGWANPLSLLFFSARADRRDATADAARIQRNGKETKNALDCSKRKHRQRCTCRAVFLRVDLKQAGSAQCDASSRSNPTHGPGPNL